MEQPDKFRRAFRAAITGLALAGSLVASPLQAQAAASMLMPLAAVGIQTFPCGVRVDMPASVTGRYRRTNAATSKASAILGGTQSALEAIRAEQAAFPAGPLLPAAGSPAAASQPLAPAALGIDNVGCTSRFASGISAPQDGTHQFAREDFLQSRRTVIRRTYFDAAWSRVSKERVGLGADLRTALAHSGGEESRLEAVNRWVNHRIDYVEDRDLYGKADYWAGAHKTLRLGKGDCEDFALLKMSLLAAAGVRKEDMFLTIARDLARRADHAVLVVRTPAGYRMLDNATDTVLDASADYDYRPVLSFNGGQAWLHGY